MSHRTISLSCVIYVTWDRNGDVCDICHGEEWQGELSGRWQGGAGWPWHVRTGNGGLYGVEMGAVGPVAG